MLGSAVPYPFRLPVGDAGACPLDLIATATSLHFGHLLRRRLSHNFHRRFLLQSCFKKLPPLNHVFRWKDIWCERALQFIEINFPQLSNDVLSSTCSSSFSFFNGGKHRAHFGNDGMSKSKMSSQRPFNGRKWTNILLAANILVYIAQVATQGKLLFWGAKINSLIDKGQLWRLATSSLLHANVGHLMVNCYSLNSVGPTVESFSGPRRYLALYLVSAIASNGLYSFFKMSKINMLTFKYSDSILSRNSGSAMSYWFCRMPSVGASGAIFGLVGSVAVFVLRHRELVGGGKEDLQQIAHVIILNMVIGLISNGIDNWGHLGGFIGGAAASWLIGPAWKRESTTRDGRKVFVDRAPMYNIFQIKRLPRQWK